MKTLRTTIALLALVTGVHAFGSPVIVTNPTVAAETIDADLIKAVFRGKKVSWANKTKVVVAILEKGSTHEEFLKKAFNISPSAFANHWRLTAMSGGGVAPQTFSSEEELLKFVAATPGAIGYVDETKADGTVNKVALE